MLSLCPTTYLPEAPTIHFLTYLMFTFSTKIKQKYNKKDSHFLPALIFYKTLINGFSQEWEHNNIKNLDLFVKLL